MNNRIHENQAQAKTACEQYVKAMHDLQADLGVWEENEDSCATTYVYARYRTESGEVKNYCLS